MPPTAVPLVDVDGVHSCFSDAGCTRMETDVDDDPSLALTVTVVGLVTCPVCVGNGANSVATPAATVTDAGTGKAAGLLLVRATTDPPAGAAPLSCTWPSSSSPLNGAVRVKVIDVTAGGA